MKSFVVSAYLATSTKMYHSVVGLEFLAFQLVDCLMLMEKHTVEIWTS